MVTRKLAMCDVCHAETRIDERHDAIVCPDCRQHFSNWREFFGGANVGGENDGAGEERYFAVHPLLR